MNRQTRPLLTKMDLAHLLGISYPTARRLADSGQFPLVRVGERDYLLRVDVERFLAGEAPAGRGEAVADSPVETSRT